jgi:heme-degrading monooxygenase HmoA
MFVTWTVLRPRASTPTAPWTPAGASWWQAGHSSPGRAQAPQSNGAWWSVVATWDDADSAGAGPPRTADLDAWHVVLEPVSWHGDVGLADGTRPFDGVPTGRRVEGAVALLTVAGASRDSGREREFFRRFGHVSRDIGRAPGHLLSLVHAPAQAPDGGPVLTFSAWENLAAGLDWAYATSRPHVSALTRQASHRLVERSGSVRCAVRSSSGTLGDLGNPLAHVRGTAVRIDAIEG